MGGPRAQRPDGSPSAVERHPFEGMVVGHLAALSLLTTGSHGRRAGASLIKFRKSNEASGGAALLRSALEKGWDAGIERMTKSGLIQRLAAANPYLHARDIERIVDVVFEQIGSALAHGDRVELRGFGAFSSRQRDARTGRNPRTGEAVEVDAKRVPYFKPGKEMRERLNLGEVTAE